MYYNSWSIAPRLRNCPIAQESLTLALPKLIQDKTNELCFHFPKHEWLAYLLGEKTEKGEYLLRDLYIPEQYVGPANVDDVTYPHLENIVGTIHSHCHMGTFFSEAVDERYLMGNHDVTVVVSEGKYQASIRTLAPCGNRVNNDTILELLDYTPTALPSWWKKLWWRKQETPPETSLITQEELDRIHIGPKKPFAYKAPEPVVLEPSLLERIINRFGGKNEKSATTGSTPAPTTSADVGVRPNRD